MEQQMKELQALKGIGKILSQRLMEASYDSVAKVAAAQPSALERVQGLSPMKIRFITTQARKIVGATERRRHSWSQGSGAESPKVKSQQVKSHL